jgi:molecular chaperone DnaK
MSKDADEPNGRIVGIDLGTTFSLVAVVERGRPRVIADAGQVLLPSVVGYSETGELLVGTPARNQLVVAPDRTVRSIKRKMGSTERVSLAGHEYTPAEVSASILRRLKEIAERDLGESVDRAVITVPAYFADAARQATREAGELAGFRVERIINEPTAAALAYGLDRAIDLKAAVYDLGGGTFDVSIVEINHGVIEVRASHGDTRLGGDDFDNLIVERLLDQFESLHGVDLRGDRRAVARLTRAAEAAKIELSTAESARIAEEYLAESESGRPLHLDVTLTRAEFEDLIRPLVRSTLDSIDVAMKAAGLRPSDLERLILVGGSTRIPLVRQVVAEHLGQEPHAEVNPDEAVADGAAIQAAIIAGVPIEAVLIDVAPRSLGIESARVVLGHVLSDRYAVVIPANKTIPTSVEKSFYTLYPDQDEAEIRVYQGENDVASRNLFLGEFLFKGISPSPTGGRREVLVRFDYDLDGIVQVAARDKLTGRTDGISVTTSREVGAGAPGQAPPTEPKLPPLDRKTEREIDGVLRRAQRLTTKLAVAGEREAADELLTLTADLERARKNRDAKTARQLIGVISDLLYRQQG